MDSTPLAACDPNRITQHTVFVGLAQRGKTFADRGYISQPLFQQLLETFGLQLITRLKSNMKNRLMPLANLLCGLIAYCHQPKKPSLHLNERLQLMPA